MSDDAPRPTLTPEGAAAKAAELKAKRCANLLPPIKPGETRNPTGNNGRKKQAALIRWLEEATEKGHPQTRIERVWQAMYLEAIKGDVNAGKALMEQHGGKPRQQLDLSSEDGTMSPLAIDVIFSKTPTDQEPISEPLKGDDGKSPTD
jgi:hypothetical protein